MNQELKAVVLAAGKGTRMKSDVPKVLHEIFNKPLIGYVLDALEFSSENIAVVGHGVDLVSDYLEKNYPETKTVLQKEQLGTGHALKSAAGLLDNFEGNILVLCGDTPLITKETLSDFVDFHNKNDADITVMSAIFDNPYGYGRIIKNEKNETVDIVEEKDADFKTKQIREINAGVYCFRWSSVKNGINEIKNENMQKEYYITDFVKWGVSCSKKICTYVLKLSDEMFGINSKMQLASAAKIMKKRKLQKLMDEGVTIIDIDTTYISPETEIAPDTTILPSVVIEGKNKIGKCCKIGPFSHLRGNCEIEDFVKIGNFVELKNAKVKSHTNVCHLSYIGDSELGSGVNIGAGTITANYDSRTKIKSKTKINDGASIGSNSVLVAPLEIGKNSMIGAGSVITKNIQANSLGLTRAEQREIKNYIKKGETK